MPQSWVAKTTVRELEALGLAPDEFTREMAIEYKNAALALQQGFRMLSSDPLKGEESARAARKTERNTEKIYRRALARLFDTDEMIARLRDSEPDPHVQTMLAVVDMFKRREVYRHMSNGADRLADAAERLHDIIVKIS